jgi:membrane protease subunit HflK
MDWTPPPRGGGREPDLNQVLEEVKQRLPNFKKPKGLWWAAVAALVIIIGSSSYYTVGPDETGVVTRFGRFDRANGPGLHLKLPLGIEAVNTVKTGRVFKEEFGFRGIAPGVRSRFAEKGFDEESLMLTGDLAVIDVKWIVQYQIRDPKLWLFAVREGVAAIRDLSEAVMRRIVGNSYADAVLTLRRVEIAAQAQKELQQLLDFYSTGISVVTVKLQDVNPPGPVQPAFNEVNEARQQKERMINEAQEAYNREIPKAIGEAQRVVTEAEGYATEQVNRAQGEAKRFTDVLASYRQAKDVTQRRLYLEAMARILNSAAKVYVVDESVKGLLPLLNLGQAGKAPAIAREVK